MPVPAKTFSLTDGISSIQIKIIVVVVAVAAAAAVAVVVVVAAVVVVVVTAIIIIIMINTFKGALWDSSIMPVLKDLFCVYFQCEGEGRNRGLKLLTNWFWNFCATGFFPLKQKYSLRYQIPLSKPLKLEDLMKIPIPANLTALPVQFLLPVFSEGWIIV